MKRDWKPAVADAKFSVVAWRNGYGTQPGMVILHPCGLSLVHPCETAAEFEGDPEPLKNWSLTHTSSGSGFGLELTFQRAKAALLLAAVEGDWNSGAQTVMENPKLKRAGILLKAKYGTAGEKERAKRWLQELETAAQ